MATGVQMEFLTTDRTVGWTIGHFTIPLYTSPNAPSPSSFSIITSLAGISHSSSSRTFSDADDGFSNSVFLVPLTNIGSHGCEHMIVCMYIL